MDMHEAVAIVKGIAQTGVRPNRDMARVAGISDHFMRTCGGFNAIMQAAGMSTYHQARIPNEQAFYAHPHQVISDHVPRTVASVRAAQRILVVGDTHFPWVHRPCMDAIHEFAAKQSPEVIVQVGDLLDQYAHSKFPRSHNVYRPEEEEELALAGARDMWARFRKDCPKAKCFQILGNHDLRPAKRVQERAPEFEHVVKAHLKAIMQFEGVVTIDDYRQELEIGDIIFHHGYRSKLGDHRDYTLSNFVCGHTHRGGVVFRKLRDKTIWELNAGYVGDGDAKALSYTSQKMTDHTLGWGWIDEHGPRFIHF